MALFGGSRSSTENVTNVSEKSAEVNQQVRDGLGIGVEGQGNVVNFTDAGAIARTANVAESVIKSGERFGENVLRFAGRQSSDAFGFGGDALQFADTSTRRSLDFASRATDKALEAGSRALSTGSQALQSAITASKPVEAETFKTLAMYGAIGFVALVLVMGFKK